jgi:hypothetical protein
MAAGQGGDLPFACAHFLLGGSLTSSTS